MKAKRIDKVRLKGKGKKNESHEYCTVLQERACSPSRMSQLIDLSTAKYFSHALRMFSIVNSSCPKDTNSLAPIVEYFLGFTRDLSA